MPRSLAIILVVVGWLIIIYSLLVLVRWFDMLAALETNSENLGYIFGSILAPMLLIAVARWLIRKGMRALRKRSQM
jgi:hypothetical protein